MTTAVTTSSASGSCFSACTVTLAMKTWSSGRWRFASCHASLSMACASNAFQALLSPSRTSPAKSLMSWSSDRATQTLWFAVVILDHIWLVPMCCLNRMWGAHPVSFAFPLTFITFTRDPQSVMLFWCWWNCVCSGLGKLFAVAQFGFICIAAVQNYSNLKYKLKMDTFSLMSKPEVTRKNSLRYEQETWTGNRFRNGSHSHLGDTG